MKIMLLNDTGIEPHIGCQAVSDAHIRMLAKQGHYVKYRYFAGELKHFYTGNEKESIRNVIADNEFMEKINEVDAVVVNGEGTLHHGAGLHYLAILAVAQELGKKTLIVNAVYQESFGFLDVLRKLDDFCVRDSLSSENAEKQGIKNRIVPDSFLEASFDYSDELDIDLSGKVVVTDWHPSRNIDVGNIILSYLRSYSKNCFFFPMFHEKNFLIWRKAPQVISNCDFVITGRHHGIYLAAVAKKPFVALPSNTYKIEGLIKMSGIPIPVCSNFSQFKDGIKFCRNNKNIFNDFFSFLKSKIPLTTFSALGKEEIHISVEDQLNQFKRDIINYLLRNPGISMTSKENRINQSTDSLYSLADCFENKKVVFFGTGLASKILYKLLSTKVDYCVDNDLKKYNTLFENMIIERPERLLLEDKNKLAIVVASQYYSEIAKQLKSMGFNEGVHFWNGYSALNYYS